jgi:hypothetical protein
MQSRVLLSAEFAEGHTLEPLAFTEDPAGKFSDLYRS